MKITAHNVLFQELNKKCLGCKHKCKQSAIATILACPQYQPKGKKEANGTKK